MTGPPAARRSKGGATMSSGEKIFLTRFAKSSG
jgi:hypothetical protein